MVLVLVMIILVFARFVIVVLVVKSGGSVITRSLIKVVGEKIESSSLLDVVLLIPIVEFVG